MSRKITPSPGRLLVVDDNKVNRLLLGRGLEQQGHTVSFAENGLLALEMVRKQPFDIILLDIQMPEMDGYQVLEQITSDLNLRDIPVIMTTAMEELDSVVKCIELGAEDYLTKPVNPVLLKARVNASLEKKRLRDQQRELVKKFATAEVAEDMQESGFSLGGKFIQATAMFSDIRGSPTAPPTRAIAAQGYLVVITPVPFNLAVFKPAAADAVIAAHPEITRWAIGGHSLGGAMAANYIYTHPDAVRGLALWAGYPAGNNGLADRQLPVVSIYGDERRVGVPVRGGCLPCPAAPRYPLRAHRGRQPRADGLVRPPGRRRHGDDQPGSPAGPGHRRNTAITDTNRQVKGTDRRRGLLRQPPPFFRPLSPPRVLQIPSTYY